MSIGVYDSYADVTGKSSSFEQVLSLLKRFSRDSLLWHCAALNYGARVWESNVAATSSEVNSNFMAALDFYYPPHFSVRLKSRALSASNPIVPFHRRQLLALQKLILQHSPASGIDVGGEPHAFGLLLLMINDHLHPNKSRLNDTVSSNYDFAVLISEFLPISESSEERLGAILRILNKMLGPLTEARRTKGPSFDTIAEFEATTTIPYETFRAFICGAVAYLNGLDFKVVLQDPGRIYLNSHRFSTTTLVDSQLSSIFQFLSAGGEILKRRMAERNFGIHDFTELRRTPMVERWLNVGLVNQWCGYLVTDPIYLFDKLITAPYWLAANKHDVAFRIFWGSLFEDYCHEVMQEAITASEMIYIPDVRNDDGQQLCDALVLEGDRLIIMEYKGFMLSAEAKYSGDADLLLQSLERNLVRSSRGQKKGVDQLRATLSYLFGPKRWIETLFPQWRDIREVFPCIVTLDSIGAAVGLSPMLQRYMPEQRNLGVRVTPIFCLWIRELERKAHFFRSSGLASIFAHWLEINPSLGTPLGQIEGEFGTWTRLASVDEAIEGMQADGEFLFPGQVRPLGPSDS